MALDSNSKLITLGNLKEFKKKYDENLPIKSNSDNIAITNNSGVVEVSSPIMDKMGFVKIGEDDDPYYYLSFDDKELVYKEETEEIVKKVIQEEGISGSVDITDDLTYEAIE